MARLPARPALTTSVSRVALPTKGSPRCFGAGRNKRRREVERLSQWRERGVRWPVLSHQVHSLQRKHACGPRSSNGARGLPARSAVQDWNAQHPLQRATVPCICQPSHGTLRFSLAPTDPSPSIGAPGRAEKFRAQILRIWAMLLSNRDRRAGAWRLRGSSRKVPPSPET